MADAGQSEMLNIPKAHNLRQFSLFTCIHSLLQRDANAERAVMVKITELE